MWTHTTLFLYLSIIALSHPLGTSLESYQPGDLAGLLQGDDFLSSFSSAFTSEPPPGTAPRSNTLGGTLTNEIQASKGTISMAKETAHSIIGTPPPVYTTLTAQLTKSFTNSASTTAPIPTVSIGVTREAPSMPPAEATEWKVIGLAVIAIAFVATTILAIVFFDSWWGFLGDLVFGKRRSQGVEDMVPDWEKRSWEFKLANEDGHRYPTLASLDYIAKEHAGKDEDGAANLFASDAGQVPPGLTAPKPSYLCNYDPHPLEPLVRRPSAKPMNSPGGVA